MTSEQVMIGIDGLGRDRALQTRIRTQVAAAIGRIGPRPVSAHVAFTDENGPKGGPAIRCAFTILLPHRQALRVENLAVTRRLAFDGGFDVLERRLERYRGRERDSRRHPKKYYAARLLVEEEKSSARPKGRRASKSRQGGRTSA